MSKKSQYANIFKEEVVKREDNRQFSASPREDFYRNDPGKEPAIQFFQKDDTVCSKKGNRFYYKGVT